MLERLTNMPRKLKSALKSIRAALRSNKYHNKYRKIISSGCSLKDIEVLSIEFCSICNLKCRYCYLEEGQRPPFLDMNIYDKLLSEICKNEEYRIKIMEWPISGCFFLHPKHGEIITMTGEYRKRFPHFRPWIILNDNMTMFGADRIDFVLKTNIINQIICSIDGVDKETFEYMRPGADYGRVLENTASLLRITRQRNSSMVIQINNGRDENCRGKKRDSRLRGIFEQANLVTEWEPVDWNESFHRGNPCYKPYPSFCSFVFES